MMTMSLEHLDVITETSDRFGIVACAAVKLCDMTTEARDKTCEGRTNHLNFESDTTREGEDGKCLVALFSVTTIECGHETSSTPCNNLASEESLEGTPYVYFEPRLAK